MKLPNGYGSVYKLSGKRRNPWVARKTTGWKQIEEKKKAYPIYNVIGYFPTRTAALQALASYNEDPYDLKIDTMTFEQLYEKWSEVHYEKVSDSAKRSYRAAYNTCAAIKNMKVADIKLDHLQTMIDTSGKNAPALKNIKILIGLMYDHAVKFEILPMDKREMVRYLDVKKAGNPNAIKRMPFTEKELSVLWKTPSDDNISIILMLNYTGVRIGELLDLKKENVNLKERWFEIIDSKTAAGIRKVPIAKKIFPLFEYWMNKNDCEYLLSTPEGKHFVYRNYYDYHWIPSMLKLNMGKFVIEEGKKEPVYIGHRPHDARHTLVSLLVKAGIDDRLVKKIVGHKDKNNVTQFVYTHLEMKTLLEAVDKI